MDACSVGACDCTGVGDCIDAGAVSQLAGGVKELMKLANDLDLKTSVDDRLHHCTACDCALRVKVWAKMSHVKPHTSDRVKSALDPRCWMLKEWDEA